MYFLYQDRGLSAGLTAEKQVTACNAIMVKVDRIASLVKSKCLQTLLYCLEVWLLNAKDIKSLKYHIKNYAFFKIFQTNSNEIVKE